MAAKPSALPPPPPQFGRLERASVSLSSADHSSGSNHQLPTSSSSYSSPPPNGSSAAKETLLQVQRESSNGVTLRKPKANQRDKTLRQKGILLSSHSGPRSLSPPPPPNVHPPLNTECYHPLPPPPLLPSPTHSSTNPTASSRPSNHSPTLTSRTTGDDGVLNVFQVMQLSAAASLPEAVGSPDSGYDDLATAALVCNRSDSIGSTSSSSSRRTGPNSGVPSSLFSVRDSELELVKEEDGSDEDDEETKRKERGTSNTSSEQSDTLPSPSFPRLSLEESNNFYAPDDETVIQTVQRPGIKRSYSTDMKRMASTVRPGGRAESYSSNANNRVVVNKPAGAERGRSQSLFTREGSSISGSSGSSNGFFESMKDTFQLQDELSKENYHFVLSEALISVIEEYKSLLREQAYDEHLALVASPDRDSVDLASAPSTPSHPNPPPSPFPYRTTSFPYLSRTDTPTSPTVPSSPTPPSPVPSRDVSLLRLVDSQMMTNTAESTAHGLLQYISRVLGGASSVEFRVPEQIVQLPSDFIASIKREEQLHHSVANSTTIRGEMDWAPPRKTIIHTMYSPPKDVSIALKDQNYRCAGCGVKIDISHTKLLRFCYYIGKYFCTTCHQNSLSYIPAYIMSKWNFKKYPVSNFARDTLAEFEKEPHFNLDISRLYYRIYELKKVKDLREQISFMRRYIFSCRETANLCERFTQFGHLVGSDVHIYSMEDFVNVKSGQLSKQLKFLATETEKHIKSCPLCKGKGFVCEYCQNEEDILYPFELKRVSSCPACSCCFHKDCCSQSRECPRCKRIRERQQSRLKTMMIADRDD
ncbi:PREDICTED: run domain Beclin-1-interacting and cysteine-rich domain-containing protein-like [Amphimedon queenslandica]|uniref:Rubicon Homology domain-containing protein n=1 Tax=Amphimedon queenslandica TaxID=400682 RepID=A0A1X7VQX3_AMPQE|nr:PREDICTED: run domain Beclin-1-interacting and cysteine-rich domain-containing protein-like [Amphimedon queenslandica]|eukprot:XP_003383267.1 PREDICTED: run domain Beclin-1-interacting and cysteine-rich domain-containing protein-like [Amphimedon queenslandica]